MTLPRRKSQVVSVDGVDYRVILRQSIELPSDHEEGPRTTWIFHVVVAQREDGGPRLHGMLRGDRWEPGYPWLIDAVESWLPRLLTRTDIELDRPDVYDHPHGVTVWPRDWPTPEGDTRP